MDIEAILKENEMLKQKVVELEEKLNFKSVICVADECLYCF